MPEEVGDSVGREIGQLVRVQSSHATANDFCIACIRTGKGNSDLFEVFTTLPDSHIDLTHLYKFRLHHQHLDDKLQKEVCFTAGLLCTMAKGKEDSKDFHDAEVILAHYRVDKPCKCFYQL